MSTEDKIKSLKRIILDQMEHGQWTESKVYLNDGTNNTSKIFECRDAKIYILGHAGFFGRDKLEISIGETYMSNRLSLSDLGIGKLYFLYLLHLFIKPKCKSAKKAKDLNRIASISDAFFQTNKELARDMKLDDIIK